MSIFSNFIHKATPGIRAVAQIRSGVLQGRELNRQRDVSEALAAKKQAQEDEMFRLRNTLTQLDIDAKRRPPSPEWSTPITGLGGEQRVFNKNDPQQTQTIPGVTARVPTPTPDDPYGGRTREQWLADEKARADATRAPAGPSQEPLVQVQQADGSVVWMPRSHAAGQNAPTRVGAGAGTKGQRIQAIANVSDALDAYERTISDVGSTVEPSIRKSVLETAYRDVTLQMKEMYNLGVLNGPDLMLMEKILNDPTSVMGRVLSYGSGDEQTRRALAQIGEVRKILGRVASNLAEGNAALPTPTAAPMPGGGGRGGGAGAGRGGPPPTTVPPAGTPPTGGPPTYEDWLRARGRGGD